MQVQQLFEQPLTLISSDEVGELKENCLDFCTDTETMIRTTERLVRFLGSDAEGFQILDGTFHYLNCKANCWMFTDETRKKLFLYNPTNDFSYQYDVKDTIVACFPESDDIVIVTKTAISILHSTQEADIISTPAKIDSAWKTEKKVVFKSESNKYFTFEIANYEFKRLEQVHAFIQGNNTTYHLNPRGKFSPYPGRQYAIKFEPQSIVQVKDDYIIEKNEQKIKFFDSNTGKKQISLHLEVQLIAFDVFKNTIVFLWKEEDRHYFNAFSISDGTKIAERSFSDLGTIKVVRLFSRKLLMFGDLDNKPTLYFIEM